MTFLVLFSHHDLRIYKVILPQTVMQVVLMLTVVHYGGGVERTEYDSTL